MRGIATIAAIGLGLVLFWGARAGWCAGGGAFEVPEWDHDSQAAVRGHLLALSAIALLAVNQERVVEINIFAATLGVTNRFGTGVTLGLQLLGPGLQQLALLFECIDFCHIELESTGSQALGCILYVGAQVFGI